MKYIYIYINNKKSIKDKSKYMKLKLIDPFIMKCSMEYQKTYCTIIK